jgi:hypothetical protein
MLFDGVMLGHVISVAQASSLLTLRRPWINLGVLSMALQVESRGGIGGVDGAAYVTWGLRFLAGIISLALPNTSALRPLTHSLKRPTVGSTFDR